MKKILLTGTIVLFSLLAHAQEYASAYIIETGSDKLSKIMVVFENRDREIIPLNGANFTAKDFEEKCFQNLKTITDFFSSMESKGYRKEAMTVQGAMRFVVFRKE